MKSDKEIINELQQATVGLLMMSESDYPFKVVSIEGKEKLTPEYLRKLAGKNNGDTVEIREIDDFFRNAVSEPEWKNESQIATARQFQNLVKLLQGEVSDTRVYRIGEIDITVFLLGKSHEGNWLGLSTRVIET
jgi:outer membrane translocation and assembly module TamA